LGDVHHVERYEFAQFVGCLHYDLVHLHAGGVPVVSEAYHYQLLGLGQDGLVHLPAVVQVRQQVRHLKEIILL
jgi:hypothetical protein